MVPRTTDDVIAGSSHNTRNFATPSLNSIKPASVADSIARSSQITRNFAAPSLNIIKPTPVLDWGVDDADARTSVADIIPCVPSNIPRNTASRGTKNDPPNVRTDVNIASVLPTNIASSTGSIVSSSATMDLTGDIQPSTAVVPSHFSWDTSMDPTGDIQPSSAVVPLHFSLDKSMDLLYILKLNSFALKRRTDIIAKVKRIAPHMNLYDTVSYACWEIDAEDLRRSTSVVYSDS